MPDILLRMHDEILRELYPGLTEDELSEVAENLDRYLLVAWEIMEEPERTDAAP